MQKPKGYLWDWPGFPSIFVPYAKTNDFFYSGHVGSCVIVALEAQHMGYRWLKWFALFGVVVQFVLMVALRSHYFIDLVSGILFAHYFFIMSRTYVYHIDRRLCRLKSVDPKQEELNMPLLGNHR